MILTTAGQFVVDFLLEEKHLLTPQLIQCTSGTLPPKEAVKSAVGVGEVFRVTQDMLALSIKLLIWHPWDTGGYEGDREPLAPIAAATSSRSCRSHEQVDTLSPGSSGGAR
jgi:hypothetical protein